MDIQLKEKLIAKIASIEDEKLLHQLLCVIDLEVGADQIYHLNKDEQTAINEGIAQLDNGMFLSNEEANKQADRCLNR